MAGMMWLSGSPALAISAMAARCTGPFAASASATPSWNPPGALVTLMPLGSKYLQNSRRGSLGSASTLSSLTLSVPQLELLSCYVVAKWDHSYVRLVRACVLEHGLRHHCGKSGAHVDLYKSETRMLKDESSRAHHDYMSIQGE